MVSVYTCMFVYTLLYVCVSCAQSCQTLCDPMDCSLPGSSVHGISQARILEPFAITSFRGSSRPRDWTHKPTSPALKVDSWSAELSGKPTHIYISIRVRVHISGIKLTFLDGYEILKHSNALNTCYHGSELFWISLDVQTLLQLCCYFYC